MGANLKEKLKGVESAGVNQKEKLKGVDDEGEKLKRKVEGGCGSRSRSE